MGSLGDEIRSRLAKELGPSWVEQNASVIDRLWDEIESSLLALNLPYSKVRIYQDGLPVCGREIEIVNELASAGSRNHRLVQQLHENGAMIMGTESGELLVEEYQRVKQLLAEGGSSAGANQAAGRGTSLMQKRDRFMATRINATLEPGEIGILFAGMLHSVQRYLAADIKLIGVHPSARDAAVIKRARRGSA
jgi:hypothetical protein